jgi:hypothetical protein
MSVYRVHVWYLWTSEESIRSPGTDGFEPPCGAGNQIQVLWKTSQWHQSSLTPFLFKCSVTFLCLICINDHFPAHWVFFHGRLWGAGIYRAIFRVRWGMLFCLSDKLISFFGVQCPRLSSSWESPLYFPQRRRRGVMSHHTDERGSCKVQDSICSNSKLTGHRAAAGELAFLHRDTRILPGQTSCGTKPVGVNLFLHVWGSLQCIDAALFCKRI